MVMYRIAVTIISIVVFLGVIPVPSYSQVNHDLDLYSLDHAEILSKLDLDNPDLSEVKKAVEKNNRVEALTALRMYYRQKYAPPEVSAERDGKNFEEADGIVNHIFQWGPYEAADYGKDINWEWDPRGDIEWVAAVYRFYWALPLAAAYRETGEEKYAAAFVELASDWITKHPLQKRKRTHPVYKTWKAFAWLDIQTGIRATNLCKVFQIFVHADAFTPEFLGILMASLYDHQVKTELIPMGIIHNKAIFEQRGFINIAYTFPEFGDSERWMKLALQRSEESLLDQTTSDGVQREWAGGYHVAVLGDAVEILDRMTSFGIPVSGAYRERVRKMYDYLFAIATPDLGLTMFGDASRPRQAPEDRTAWPLYNTLLRGTEVTGNPIYAARAALDTDNLPDEKSFAFPEAGMYVMRDTWGPEQIYFALHCSPPAVSHWHDQPDNGTFEMYAFGRWLLTDTGFYTYGHDPEARAWHRQTRVHQTMTLDGKDSEIDAEQLLWHTSENLDALVVQNRSYENLIHRRTVWFVKKQFFVVLDEAIGDAEGILDLHFQPAVGELSIDKSGKQVHTNFKDANVLLWTMPDAPVSIEEEEGWYAWEYGSRVPRKTFRYRHRDQAPAYFLTVLVPYRGTDLPGINAKLDSAYEVGNNQITVKVNTFNRSWRIGRDLMNKKAWCEMLR